MPVVCWQNRRIREHIASTGLGVARKSKEESKAMEAEFKDKLSTLRREFEDSNSGDFERIFPSEDETLQAEYEVILEQSARLFEEKTKGRTSGRASVLSKEKKEAAEKEVQEEEERKKAKAAAGEGKVGVPSARLLSHTASVAAKKTSQRPARNLTEHPREEAYDSTEQSNYTRHNSMYIGDDPAVREIAVPTGVHLDSAVHQWIQLQGSEAHEEQIRGFDPKRNERPREIKPKKPERPKRIQPSLVQSQVGMLAPPERVSRETLQNGAKMLQNGSKHRGSARQVLVLNQHVFNFGGKLA